MTHVNIPIFIPHLGCPNQCIFCNQRYISGTIQFDETSVEKIINNVLNTIPEGCECEIAFFGGSFTGIDRNLMIRLLDIAQKYVCKRDISGIRMSTRPDYINEDIIDILKNYKISCVELGIQSMRDEILSELKRGHTVADTIKATQLLKSAGIPFVGQMMVGLPSSTREDEIFCAEQICKMGAIASRIYPTLVFNNTELKDLTLDKKYNPLSIEEAVTRSRDVLDVFVKNSVECIRIGLCESDNLHSEETFFAGPNHPSLGEMVKSALYLKKLEENISGRIGKYMEICCPKGATSQVIGNKRKNIDYLKSAYGFKMIKVVEDNDLSLFDVKITVKEEK